LSVGDLRSKIPLCNGQGWNSSIRQLHNRNNNNGTATTFACLIQGRYNPPTQRNTTYNTIYTTQTPRYTRRTSLSQTTTRIYRAAANTGTISSTHNTRKLPPIRNWLYLHSIKTNSAYLENGQDLRSLYIPSTLRDRFLKIAEPNTSRNLETCGILCGVLVPPPPTPPPHFSRLMSAQQRVYNWIFVDPPTGSDVRYLHHNRRISNFRLSR
jgi:hypothetical protein